MVWYRGCWGSYTWISWKIKGFALNLVRLRVIREICSFTAYTGFRENNQSRFVISNQKNSRRNNASQIPNYYISHYWEAWKMGYILTGPLHPGWSIPVLSDPPVIVLDRGISRSPSSVLPDSIWFRWTFGTFSLRRSCAGSLEKDFLLIDNWPVIFNEDFPFLVLVALLDLSLSPSPFLAPFTLVRSEKVPRCPYSTLYRRNHNIVFRHRRISLSGDKLTFRDVARMKFYRDAMYGVNHIHLVCFVTNQSFIVHQPYPYLASTDRFFSRLLFHLGEKEIPCSKGRSMVSLHHLRTNQRHKERFTCGMPIYSTGRISSNSRLSMGMRGLHPLTNAFINESLLVLVVGRVVSSLPYRSYSSISMSLRKRKRLFILEPFILC